MLLELTFLDLEPPCSLHVIWWMGEEGGSFLVYLPLAKHTQANRRASHSMGLAVAEDIWWDVSDRP